MFYTYGHHDLDIVRATAAAAVAPPSATGSCAGSSDDDDGGAEACWLKDVPAGGAVYVCAAAIQHPKVAGVDTATVAAGPGPGTGGGGSGGPWVVGRHWLCRPAGPYERLEDAGLAEVSRWGKIGSGPPDPTAAPRRRRLLRVEAVGDGSGRSGPTLPAAVGRLAARLLSGSEGGGRCRGTGTAGAAVPWGILFRVPTADLKAERVEDPEEAEPSEEEGAETGA